MSFAAAIASFKTGTGAAGTTINVPLALGGLTPVVLWFFTSGRTEDVDAQSAQDIVFSYSFAVSPTSRRCIAGQSDQGVTPSATNRVFRNDAILLSINTAGTINGSLDLNSVGANTVQLIVDTQFLSDFRGICVAIAGTDITGASIVDFTKSAAAAPLTQDITGFGFTPKYGEIINIVSTGAINAAPGTSMTAVIGKFTTDTIANQIAMMESITALATTDTWSYVNDVECNVSLQTTTTITSRGSVTTGIPDGFTLSIPLANASATRNSVLGIAGTFQVKLLSFFTQTDTITPIVPNVGFIPILASLMSHCKVESTLGALQAENELSLGAAIFPSSSNQSFAINIIDPDNVNPSAGASSIHLSDCYVNLDTAGAVEGSMDVASDPLGALGLIMTDADPTQKFVLGAVFGAAPAVVGPSTTAIISPITINGVITAGTIGVWGITAKNTSMASLTVTLTERDGTTLIDTITIPSGDTKYMNIPFLAKNGVIVTTPESTTVVVYHTQII